MEQQKYQKHWVQILILLIYGFKLFEDNYEQRCVAYSTAMKDMFNQIPLTMIKALSPKQKVQKLMIEIGGGWYMLKVLREYLH